MPPSIRDVARAAGVSVGTVSRAFNGYSDIKEETKLTILQVAKELGYIPNLNAKALSAKNHQTMAIILAGFQEDRGLTEDLVIQMIRGACRYAAGFNMEFAVYILSSEEQKEKTFEQFCGEHSLAGALIFGLRTTDAYYSSLSRSRTACVTVDVLVDGDHVGYVGTDNVHAYNELTLRALALNHRKIVFLNGREEATVCGERLQGVQDALAKNGLELDDNLYTDFRADRAESLVRGYIAKNNRESASIFICASDAVALGALKGIRGSGYTPGKEFSVTGFDGTRIAAYSDPTIATVDQNMEEKGYIAARMLHAMVDGRQTKRYCVIPYRLVDGESLGPCRTTA